MIIQSMWIGDRLTDVEHLAIRSHLTHNHEYHLYTYGPLANVPDGTTIRDGNEILPESQIFAYKTDLGKGSYSAFSNYFRYQLLLERGGWWCDTDVVCLRSQYPVSINGWPIIATERQQGLAEPHVASCVIYCPAGHKIMQFCCEEANKKDRTKIVWGEVGPRLLSEAMKAALGAKIILPPKAFCPIDWYNVEDLFDPEQSFDRIAHSYGVHLWNEMWRRKGLDKQADYASGSIYQRLKAITR